MKKIIGIVGFKKHELSKSKKYNKLILLILMIKIFLQKKF